MKGIFDAYVMWPFGKKFTFESVTRIITRDSTVRKMSVDDNKITKLTVQAVASARLKKSFAIYRSRKMREDMTRL